MDMSAGPDWIVEVERAQVGDQAARSSLVQRFTPLARATATRLVNSAHDVDDVVQESFIEALSTLAQLRTPEAFPAWLRLIVRKHADRARRLTRASAPLMAAAEIRSPAPGPELVVEQRDLSVAVRAGLATMRDPDRRLLELRYLAGWTVPDLVELTGVSSGAVRKRLHDARRRLRPILHHLHEHKEKPMHDISELLGQVHRASQLTVPDAPRVVRPDQLEPAATGLKIIDAIAPIARGGTIEMVGPAGTGHLVLALELLYRLGRTETETACVAVGSSSTPIGSQPNFGGLITEVDEHDRHAVILTDGASEAPQALRAGANLANGLASLGTDVVLIVDQPTADVVGVTSLIGLAGLSDAGGSVTVVLVNALPREAPLPDESGLDTRLVFSVEPFALGIFPALDPVRSRAAFANPPMADEVRRLLSTASQVRAYFHQPMWIAEDYTGEPGVWIDQIDAEAAVRTLIAG